VAYVIFAGALISAILSTVDTILLVASGLVAHNIVAPILGIESDRTRLRLARAGVLVLGAVSLLLALRSTGVAELVEEASSFGSAGVLVVVCFALFSRIGGAAAAAASLVGALAFYLLGSAIGWPYPFLTSMLAALAMYLLGAAWDAWIARALVGRAPS
jgi:Na+/pantothenate symporter